MSDFANKVGVVDSVASLSSVCQTFRPSMKKFGEFLLCMLGKINFFWPR